MRKGYDGLCGLVRTHMQMNPLCGDVFVFIGRRRNQFKLLCWEKDGFIMFCKRLEKGTFELPKSEETKISVEVLSCVLQGIKLSSIRQRPRYNHTPVNAPVQVA